MNLHFKSAPALIVAIMFIGLGFASQSNATIVLNTAHHDCVQPGCQSVGFQSNDGSTVVGNTNPAPIYNVYVDSLVGGVSLHGNGSNVNNSAGNGSGFSSFLIRPESGWGWSTIDFQLDSLYKDQPIDIGGLSFTAKDQFNNYFSMSANFPWEGDKGENQHYRIDGLDGQLITSLQVDYIDPLGMGNLISDMHNIDVKSAQVPSVPVPPSLGLLMSGLAGLGVLGRAKSKKHAV